MSGVPKIEIAESVETLKSLMKQQKTAFENWYNILQQGKYIEVENSPNFFNLPLRKIIPEYLNKVKRESRNKTMKTFRALIRQGK